MGSFAWRRPLIVESYDGKGATYRLHEFENRGIEKITWRTGKPSLVLTIEFLHIQVAYNTGHDDIATSPRGTEIEAELVVSDILAATNGHLMPG